MSATQVYRNYVTFRNTIIIINDKDNNNNNNNNDNNNNNNNDNNTNVACKQFHRRIKQIKAAKTNANKVTASTSSQGNILKEKVVFNIQEKKLRRKVNNET